jgi:maltooligosyltrehalose trehalohydrolase
MWRSATAAELGASYGFFIDGEGPFPDPRSQCQPDGVHGLSRVVDHDKFPWTDSTWQAPPLASAVLYELHVGTFTSEGTFEAVVGKLDHLRSLGATHVELMPVAEFSGDWGWGYDGVDLYAPHHSYGRPDNLKHLINSCHNAGLAVLLDVVYNHLGPAGNYLPKFGPYFTSRHATPWGDGVNLDGPDSDLARRFFIDNALMWLRDYHFDGLRLDAVHAMFDQSAEHFLAELAGAVRALSAELGRHLVVIAESDLNDPRLVRAPEIGGYGLDAQWNDDFHHALHTVLTGERNGYYMDFGGFRHLARCLERGFVYDGCYSEFRGRRHGASLNGLPGSRFLAYLQNHDQIGNRARGERSSHLLSLGRLKIGAALLMTSPFVPMLFQGEEWGATTPFQYFTHHEDPGLGAAVSNGRRREFAAFGWDPSDVPDPQDQRTFLNSKLDWGELQRSTHRELLEWHRALIRLRHSQPSLTSGRLDEVRTRWSDEASWFAFQRGPVRVVCNLGEQIFHCHCPGGLLLSSEPVQSVGDVWALPPDSVVLFQATDSI